MKKDLFDLSGKVIVLTGGLGLLGLNFAEALLEKGAILTLIDIVRTEEAEKILNERFGSVSSKERVSYQQGDITDKRCLIGIKEKCLQKFGKINILLNVAALNPKIEKGRSKRQTKKTFEDTELDDWNEELNINLTGTMLCCQIFGSSMKRGSSIINVASVYAVVGPDQSIYPDGFIKPASYSASKGGIIALTKYLASYWGEKGIRVNCLSFGGVENGQDEEFIQKYSSKTFLKRMAQPNEYNGLVIYLSSDASSYMTGSNIIIDGGLTS